MKRFALFFYRLMLWISLPGYLLCASSSYLAPTKCFFTDALALAYPFALAALFLFLFISLLRKQRVAFLIVLVILAGYRNLSATIALRPFASQEATDSSSIKVLTWNVFFFLNLHAHEHDTAGNPLRKMVDLIARENADVLCFQEYLSINGSRHMLSMDGIMDSLGYKYKIYSGDQVNKYWGGGISHHGTMLFSRIPVSDSGRIFMGHEHAIWLDVALKGKPLRVCTAHLSSLGLYADTTEKSSSENVYKITYERKGSVARKIKHIAVQHEKEAVILDSAFRRSSKPVIFCADMNSVPASYTYHKIRGEMQDAYLEKGFGLGNTYYGLSPTLRIDVCFADKRLLAGSCIVKREHLSDHYPLISSFRWKE